MSSARAVQAPFWVSKGALQMPRDPFLGPESIMYSAVGTINAPEAKLCNPKRSLGTPEQRIKTPWFDALLHGLQKAPASAKWVP